MTPPPRGPRRTGSKSKPRPAVRADPKVNQVLQMLQAGRVNEAAAIIDPLFARRGKDVAVIRAKGMLEVKRGRYADAERCLERARRLDPKHPMTFVDQAMIHQLRGRYDRMVEAATSAIRIAPDQPRLQTLLIEALVSAGRLEEAMAQVDRLKEGGSMDPSLADPLTKVLDLTGRREEAIEIAGRMGEHKALTPTMRKRMLLRRGRMQEKLGDHAAAMESFHAGHAQLDLDFDPDAFDRRVDEVLETLGKSSFPEPTTELGATRLPIMIVSMPRSGTSLLERILASHPSITGIGEESVISDTIRDHREQLGPDPVPGMHSVDAGILETLRADCLRRIGELSGDGVRTVSKHLQNWSYLPVIAAWFPLAQVVRITRDPESTGISIYGQDLPADRMPWVNRLDWIGRVVAAERRFVSAARDLVPNPWFEVVYEELVDDPAGVIPELIRSTGLEFDDRCLAPEQAESTDGGDGKRFRPTLSLHQVRKPISRDTRDRGTAWGDLLDDLRRGLREGGLGPA